MCLPRPRRRSNLPARSDWGRFEQLSVARNALSPDGQWLAYAINRSSRDNDLRIKNIASGTEEVVAFGTQPTFTADSKWIVYSIGYSEAQEERMRTQRRPVQRKLGLLRLDGTSKPVIIDGIESFNVDPSGSFVAMRRYAPVPAAGAGAAPPPAPGAPGAAPPAAGADDPAPRGVTLIVRELATGRDTTFGNVAELAWQSVSEPSRLDGRLLALTISAEDKTGNGVHLYDAVSGVHRVLDSSSSVYSGLTWRRDADDLAVLRAQTDDKREGSTHAVLTWTDVAGKSPDSRTLDPIKAVPAGMRTVSFRRPSWSEDGKTVFVGVAEWAEKPASARKPEPADAPPAQGAPSGAPGAAPAAAAPAADDMPSVDIWHARDVDVMARQKLTARADRQRNLLAAWHLDSGALVQLGKSSRELVVPIRRQKLAYVSTWDSLCDGPHHRPSGGRHRLARPRDRNANAGRAGRERPEAAGQSRRALPALSAQRSLLDGEYRHARRHQHHESRRDVVHRSRVGCKPFKQKPPFGIAGWTKDDGTVLLYDKFDIWQVAADGSKATRLTDGAAERSVSLRLARRRTMSGSIVEADVPCRCSASGRRSRDTRAWRRPRSRWKLIFQDVRRQLEQGQRTPTCTSTSPRSSRTRRTRSSADLRSTSAKQVTKTNPFQAKYAWGRAEVVEFKSERGERLQGCLHYPAGYEPGKKYPMVVYLYEKLSDGCTATSRRPSATTTTSPRSPRGLFLVPARHRLPSARAGAVGASSASGRPSRKVVPMGAVDPERVGMIGHSWGGFDAAYLATHSKSSRPSVAGAPITNLISNYGSHHWSSGIAETDHIETGQQRMEVPLWEDLPAYIRNSAVFGVNTMTTPLLIEVGDADGTVFWHQGVELYNIARRAKKDVVMLVYGGEDHGLRRKANQIDYHQRILQWFGHYLKGEPAAPVDHERFELHRPRRRTEKDHALKGPER